MHAPGMPYKLQGARIARPNADVRAVNAAMRDQVSAGVSTDELWNRRFHEVTVITGSFFSAGKGTAHTTAL